MTENFLSQDQKEKSEHRESSRLRNQPRKNYKTFIPQYKILKKVEFKNNFHFPFHHLLLIDFNNSYSQNNMLKNNRKDLVQSQPIEIIPNKTLIYSNTNLLADTCSPRSLSITITSRPSELQPSPIKQYKDQQYFSNLALTKPPSKFFKLA